MSKRDKYVAVPEEVVEELGHLNEIRDIITPRGKTVRFQRDYSACVSVVDTSQAHLTDLNWLFENMKKDDLLRLIATRDSARQPMYLDLTELPATRDELLNARLVVDKAFEKLPQELQALWGDGLTMVKALNNPQSRDALERVGLLKPSEKAAGFIEEASGSAQVKETEVSDSKK